MITLGQFYWTVVFSLCEVGMLHFVTRGAVTPLLIWFHSEDYCSICRRYEGTRYVFWAGSWKMEYRVSMHGYCYLLWIFARFLIPACIATILNISLLLLAGRAS